MTETNRIHLHGITHSRSQGMVDHADRFAERAHGEQKRKYTGIPYIEHPREVARIVASVTEGIDLIAAALLHDVLEDTDVTYEQLNNQVGDGFHIGICKLVVELTDVTTLEDGNRATRKEIERKRLANISKSGKLVKLADIISNTKDIAANDPKFGQVYIREKAALIEVLREGSEELYQIAKKQVDDFLREYPQ